MQSLMDFVKMQPSEDISSEFNVKVTEETFNQFRFLAYIKIGCLNPYSLCSFKKKHGTNVAIREGRLFMFDNFFRSYWLLTRRKKL